MVRRQGRCLGGEVMDLRAKAQALAQGIADLPIEPWPQPWLDRVSGLIQLAMEEVRQECLAAVDAVATATAFVIRLEAEAQRREDIASKSAAAWFHKASGAKDLAGEIRRALTDGSITGERAAAGNGENRGTDSGGDSGAE